MLKRNADKTEREAGEVGSAQNQDSKIPVKQANPSAVETCRKSAGSWAVVPGGNRHQ